jgi:thiol:disulfide interchange protein
MIAIAMSCGTPDDDTAQLVPDLVRAHDDVKVQWEHDWAQALKRAQAEGKPVLISFTTDWCVWCKRLETTTYQDRKVAELLATRVVPLSQEYDGADKDRAQELGVAGPPTIILTDSKGSELGRIPGYMPPAAFLKKVEGILEARLRATDGASREG